MTMIDLTDAERKIAALSWGRPEGGEWNTKKPPWAIHLEAIMVWRMCAAKYQSDRRFRGFGHRNIEAIQGHRNQAIEADKIAKFGRAMRAEGIDCSLVGQLRQHTAARERGSDIIGFGLIAGEISRALASDDGGKFRIRELVVLGDRDMGIDFVSRPEMRAGHENSDLAGGVGQALIAGTRPW